MFTRDCMGLVLMAALLIPAEAAVGQTAADYLGPAGVVPLNAPQPPARLIVDPPLPAPLARGQVFIQYRAENLRIEPVFGPKATEVTPRIGHLHVSLDNAPWHWADASGEPLILVGLPPGPHQVLVTLADANHHPLDRQIVHFVVPATAANTPSSH
ncbi:hypothetical protein HLH28_04385 [Gluconacetobacter tumulisoli]|uniref:DUF4399 domain-containing protein n=2 Tax=Gluconacetobacter tumulisoli TaxID=1286189 RepID=A0A7W4K5Z7_9PROT|nr:hypothetical protein [Gluconacetobacter tumulisoli]